MMDLVYDYKQGEDAKSWQTWSDGYTLKSSLWLDVWDLRLHTAASLKYIQGLSSMKYGIKL